MNEISIYDFPEMVKEVYQKHFPEDQDVRYGNIIHKLDVSIGTGIIPTGAIILTTNGTHDVTTYSCADVRVPLATGTTSITSNGDHNVFDYATAHVAVPLPSGAITVTENSTYNVTNICTVTVSVPGPSETTTITQNGTYDMVSISTATINVPQPSGETTFTENGEYPISEYATAIVNTPVASGTTVITTNGTYDVSTYATAEINTPVASGTTTISVNGVYDVSTYASAEVSVSGGGGTDWHDTITDDWDTIIANAAAGTVSGYSIGDTKTIEFMYNGMPTVIQFMIVDKSHETISGSQDTAALTFMAKYISLHNLMNSTNTNVGGWLGTAGDLYADSLNETNNELDYGCVARKELWKLYKAFPSNLQTAIKTVDKYYDDADSSVQMSKEKLFLPCLEETGATYSNSTPLPNESIYSYFNTSADNRKLSGFGASYYSLRVRRKSNTQQFCAVNISNGNGTANNATTINAICPCFCL